MKSALLNVLLAFSTVIAGFSVFSNTSRRLVLGWLGIGISQSCFLLVIGFELLALLNLLFVAASATVLQVYAALFGTGAIYQAERVRSRQDWIYGIGAGATLAAILTFAVVGTFPEAEFSADLTAGAFSRELLARFPELPWILAVIFFLSIVVWAVIGRPGWKVTRGSRL